MAPPSAATVQIRDAVVRDSFAVTSVLTDACAGTAFGRSLTPGPSAVRGPVQLFIGDLVAEAFAEGTVRVAVADDQILGAALWAMDHGTGHRAGAASSAQALRRLADDRCPPGVPHHRLLYLGVRPDRQSRGIGTALLTNHHALLHRTRLPSLVVADDLSEPLFEQHRYSRVGPSALTPGGLPMSVMWRSPDRPGAS